MKKEAEVQKELSDWLTDSFPVEVYWAEDFEENTDYNTFTVENSGGEKPDLLVCGKRTIAIEVKNGNDSSNVYDGIVELNDYLKDMLNNDPTYLVQGEEKKPEIFLLATQHSVEGRLFKEEREPERRDGTESGKQYPIKQGNLPRFEWYRTEALAQIQSRIAKKIEKPLPIGIGVLLSSKLDNTAPAKGLSTYMDGETSSTTPKMKYFKYKQWNWEKLNH